MNTVEVLGRVKSAQPALLWELSAASFVSGQLIALSLQK